MAAEERGGESVAGMRLVRCTTGCYALWGKRGCYPRGATEDASWLLYCFCCKKTVHYIIDFPE